MGTIEPAPLDDDDESVRQLSAAARRDRAAWNALLAQHRDKLRRMVALRLDRRLQGRVDPSDVIQDAYLEAVRRLPEYVRDPAPMPLFLWLRYLAVQALQTAHRRQLGAQRVMLAERSRSRGAGRPRQPRRPWRPSFWATTPAPAKRPSAPSGNSALKRP